jgi:hypothetical protein
VTEADVRKLLLAAELPRDREAELRSWALVRAEFKRRENVSWPRRRLRPLLALAAVVALLAAAFTPPGRGLADRVRDAISPAPTEPITLPTFGRLLVLTADGPWVVQRDGSKRLLGRYEDAVWSPRGLFLSATHGRTLVALEPNGRVRWTLSRPAPVRQPRWSPSGFRIAYRSGRALRVVAGDGTGDRLLARAARGPAPAWRPGSVHVLAFVDGDGRTKIVNVDTSRRDIAETLKTAPPPRELAWSGDGRRLFALVGQSSVMVFSPTGRRIGTTAGTGPNRDPTPGAGADVSGLTVRDLAPAPAGNKLAFTAFDPRTGRSSVILAYAGPLRTLFSGAGRFAGIAWSPDGRWLLVGWPDADQWLFLRAPDVRRVVTVSALSAEFDPDGSGDGRFPRVVSWCC